MLRRGLFLSLVLAAGLAVAAPALAPAVPAQAAAPLEVRRMLRGPTVVAVLPHEARGWGKDGADEALAGVQLALSETHRCLGGKPVHFELVYAQRLTLVSRGKGLAVERADTPDGISVVLAEPDRPHRLVRSATGPSALQHLLPQAVFEYWHVQACRRD